MLFVWFLLQRRARKDSFLNSIGEGDGDQIVMWKRKARKAKADIALACGARFPSCFCFLGGRDVFDGRMQEGHHEVHHHPCRTSAVGVTSLFLRDCKIYLYIYIYIHTCAYVCEYHIYIYAYIYIYV